MEREGFAERIPANAPRRGEVPAAVVARPA
jgi:hypothetical protein